MFKAFVGGVQGIVDVASANITPWKVQKVKLDDYSSFTVKQKEGYFILYQKKGCYDCLVNITTMKITLSVFRLTDEKESRSHYHSMVSRLNVILSSSSAVYTEGKLQELCDTVRQNPTWTSAHVAAYSGLFECFRHPEIAGQLNSTCTGSGITPLMTAVIGKQHQCAVELLKLGAKLDAQDENGDTVYHKAVDADPAIIPMLVDYDKDDVINRLNNKGFTALSLACQKKMSEVVGHLVQHGADPSVTAHDTLPIHTAVDNEDEKCVEEILKKYPDQIHAKDGRYGGSPLHWVKSRKMIDVLSAYEPNLDARSLDGDTPLHVMLNRKRTECVLGLLSHGADPSVQNEAGDTPLHLVARKEDIELLRTLIVNGGKVNERNKQKQSPRHIVATSNFKSKDNMLYMLHVSGAERCRTEVKGCCTGCSAEGGNNGKPDPDTESLLESDAVAIADDLLNSYCFESLEHTGPVKGLRVLTLDGGGIKGLVTIQILMALEEALGKPIGECFDWIGGTSTGGILAVGLALGRKLSYLKSLYVRLKDEIFQGKRPYPSKNFEDMIKKEAGEEMMMTDIKGPKVMLFALLADRFPAELHAFRSYDPTLEQGHKCPEKKKDGTDIERDEKNKKPEDLCFQPPPPSEQPVWKAIRSSGAAPTYFKASDAYLDGGLISNNPTLDVLAEIQEYNLGLKLKNRGDECQDIGVVVSLGTGRLPKRYSDAFDVYMPEGLLDVTKVAQGVQTLIKILVDQACLAEGRPVDRARSWCSALHVPFFRLSPRLTEDIPLDTNDDKILAKMMWDSQVYIAANKARIHKIADLLRR